MRKIIIVAIIFVLMLALSTPAFAAPETPETPTTSESSEAPAIHATSMDVNDYESEMSTGSSQTITVVLYPSGAEDEIKYSSSDTSVATVSSGGKIDAKAAGKTKIKIAAGSASKNLTLTVIVPTKDISLSSDYITLKIDEKYKLKASVTPKDAEQSLTYKSSDSSVAKVNEDGVIKGVGLGSTSILVSNGDLNSSVSVIVNSDTYGSGAMQFGYDNPSDETEEKESEGAKEDDTDKGRITPRRLRKLQQNGKTLTIEKDDYTIILDGADILNCDNSLEGELHISKNNDGYTFSVGDGSEFLPGEITIHFKNSDMQRYKYVYLLDKSKDKYQLFGELLNGEFKTDIAGSYRITYEKIKDAGPNKMIVSIAALAIAAIAGVYILLKKFILL